jgi:hypothetical protein
MLIRSDVLYNRPLTQWTAGENESGWTIVEGDALEIGVWEGADRHWNGSWTSSSDFGDVSAEVQVRTLRTDVNGAACLVGRHTAYPDRGFQWVGYELCLGTNGSVWAIYKYFLPDGSWQETTLIDSADVPQDYNVTQWTTLEVAMYQNSIFFFVNGTMIGSGTHAGHQSGSVGLYVIDLGSDGSDFLFRNLTVWALEPE